MSGKLGASKKQNGICKRYLSMMKIMYTKHQEYSLYCKAVYLENTFCYKCYVCQVSKVQHMCNRFKMDFFFKFKWNVSKQINRNLGGFSRGSFLPLCSNETTSLKTMPSFELAYISCTLYMRLLWLISGLTKNLSRSKKV